MNEYEYTGISTRPDITGFTQVAGTGGGYTGGYNTALRVASNFDGSKVAVSDESKGTVTIYDYVETTNTWSIKAELTSGSPYTSNGFGVSISMDWDAERIAIGAHGISTVYTYDFINTTWVGPRIIQGDTGSDFGYSVSLAANSPDLLCIGAPKYNKVYIYNDIQANWNRVYVDDGLTILSRIPETPTSNIILKPEYNAYGYHVNMSPSGEYVVAGAPGTYMSNILTSNILYIESGGTLSSPPLGIDYPFGTNGDAVLNGVYPDQMKHVGNVRVLSRNGDTWSPATSIRLGQDIPGDPENYILGSNYYPGYVNRGNSTTSTGWCMPSFGWCTHIKDEYGQNNDIVITVSSPTYTWGRDRAFYSGKISRFIYSSDINDWKPFGYDLISQFKSSLYGHSFSMDYDGKRIAIGAQASFQADYYNSVLPPGRIHVLEWTNDTWDEVQPNILLTRNFNERLDRVDVSIVNGKHVFATSKQYGTMYTKRFDLTQNFIGNSRFSGYISSDVIKVGTNNGDETNNTKKIIEFGGTTGDQYFEYASIENRNLQREGKSELLLLKRSGDVLFPDVLRLKGNEVHLDTIQSGQGTVVTRNYNSDTNTYERFRVYKLSESKEYHRPSLIINTEGNVCITPFVNQDLHLPKSWYAGNRDTSPWYKGSCEAKGMFDVNGDTYMRDRLNINYFDKSKYIDTWVIEPSIFYNTRNYNVLYLDPLDTNRKLVRSECRPFQNNIVTLFGVVETASGNGQVNYLENYRGFEFVDDGKITTVSHLTFKNCRTSLWILLNNSQNTYLKSTLFSLYQDNNSRITVSLTNNGIDIEYEKLGTGGVTFNFFSNINFSPNIWYNLQFQLPLDEEPQNTNPNSDNAYISLWVDTVEQTLTLTGVPTPLRMAGQLELTLGGNTENIIIGMFMHWNVYAFTDSTIPNLSFTDTKNAAIKSIYDYGPPSEMLVVGGDGVISGKLGIGTNNPNEELEVVGTVLVNGEQGGVVVDAAGLKRFGFMKYAGTGAALVHANDQRLDFGRSDTGDVTTTTTFTPELTIASNGKVGVGTVSPNAPLHVNVSGSSSDPSTTGLYVYNPTNSAGQDSSVSIRVAGSAAGDPFLSFDIYGEAGWAFGMDNSDGNKMKLGSNWNSVSNNTKLTVDTNGYVGIGVTNPQTILHLPTYGVFRIGDGVNWWDDKKTIIKNSTSWSLGQLNGYTLNSGAGSFSTGGITDWSIWEAYTGEAATIAINGDTIAMSSPADNETINYYDEDTASRIWYISTSGNIISTSDIRRKTDIQPFTCGNSLESFKKLNTVNYKLKKPDKVTRETKKYDEVHSGFIAQEILEIFPECVKTDSDGYHSLDYRKFTLITINALKKEIEKREQLESQLASVLARLDALENK